MSTIHSSTLSTKGSYNCLDRKPEHRSCRNTRLRSNRRARRTPSFPIGKLDLTASTTRLHLHVVSQHFGSAEQTQHESTCRNGCTILTCACQWSHSICACLRMIAAASTMVQQPPHLPASAASNQSSRAQVLGPWIFTRCLQPLRRRSSYSDFTHKRNFFFLSLLHSS